MNQSNHLIPTALTVITMAFCQIGFAQYEPQSDVALGQGTMAGEVTHHSALLQTRLTRGTDLNDDGDLPGAEGFVTFKWDTDPKFTNSQETPLQPALPGHDYVVRAELTGLEADTLYFYRASYNRNENERTDGPTCSFRTLPGPDSDRPVQFIIGSCMNYIKFMHGREGRASGPLTATPEDKRQGFPAFEIMKSKEPLFFVGTGDIVYYDNPMRDAKTVEEMRRCWHEQFRFPRMIEFFQDVPGFWSKDDHDFRFNDSDNRSTKLPLPETGIRIFHEQLPIAPADATDPKTYRTIRINRDVQIWLTEGRDYRSPNKSPDGPDKTLWGVEQREWLQSTLKASDAKWKLMINPTPMVGPDDAYKKDNHASLEGFRHEANAFFDWLKTNEIDNVFLFCGDRHWQYHSIHPCGINEFACGALNDENSRNGVRPGDRKGTDPDAMVIQPYISPEPSGGFIEITAGPKTQVSFFNDEGRLMYQFDLPEKAPGN
ncbi:alkaline phosphatase D family protein [Neorhodopirellula pilleata]|uniref:Alkaline phosphatase D n=1 Tax=Neorhodopirellula pilleata TaxID=2714738 RepID=A0A5C6AUS7_9BACT|nr:alkaline phosphatase D family protein [Neorhodopirellula pilleata]TWU03191.1 Alkaline phosphatase D precursor [Neorhodopirellula pilleata]